MPERIHGGSVNLQFSTVRPLVRTAFREGEPLTIVPRHDLSASSGKIVMMHQNVGRGAAFSHGLSRKAETEAGTQLMLDKSLSEGELAAHVARIIRQFGTGSYVATQTAACRGGILSSPSDVYRPPKLLSPKIIDHQRYVAELFGSAWDRDSLDEVTKHFISCSSDDHAQALDRLREDHRRVHRQLILAGGGAAIDLIRQDNAISPSTRARLIGVVRTHIRCMMVRTARERSDELATFAKEPTGTAFAGYTGWKNVGHVLLSTCAAPAKLLQRIIKAARDGCFDDLTPEQTYDRLLQLGLVDPNQADPLRMKLNSITYQLGGSASFACPTTVKPVLETIAAVTLPLSCLTQRDMKEAGFGRMDFKEYRYGLSTSEIITRVALELHEAGHHLDACIEARLAGMPLPERGGAETSNKQLAFTATILRADAAGERHAVSLERTGSGHNLLDHSRNTGMQPVKTMRAKLVDPALAASLRQALAIDVTAWFGS